MSKETSLSHSPELLAEMKRHFILGTAGHIDHGKSSLVRALTGTDPDRLPEEQRRGMTIELGFAELAVGDFHFGIVDVPGHEKFVRTMVSGATGIDLAILVVAADDSVMPQTLEHVEILRLLGVSRLVVALTKIDVVDSDLVLLVHEDIRKILSETPWSDTPICRVSSITGAGLDELKQSMVRVAKTLEHRIVGGPFRMACDRVFTIQGRGTVVTGSAMRGAVKPGDNLEVWPGGGTCRVRDLQSHGQASLNLIRGQRAAINLSGIERESIQRGSELATPGYLEPSNILDVRLECLASCGRPLQSTKIVRLEIGTVQIPVRMILYEGDVLDPGAVGFAQLRSGSPITTTYGQRFILRDESALRTLGGGRVLRPIARRKRGESQDHIEALRQLDGGNETDRVAEVLRTTGFNPISDLHLSGRSGVEVDLLPVVLEMLRSEQRWMPIHGTHTFAVPKTVEDLKRRLVGWLERFHRSHSDRPGRPVESVVGWLERMAGRSVAQSLLNQWIKDGAFKQLGRFICAPKFAPELTQADERLLNSLVAEIRSGRFQPPGLAELSVAQTVDRKRLDRLITLAVALGELVQIEPGMYLHADCERELREITERVILERQSIAVAELREALNSSRKFVVPFVEYLDRVGFTKRMGDRRVLALAK